MLAELRALLYLDSRLLLNRLRLIWRDPRRLAPWLVVLAWIGVSRLVRVVGARGRRSTATYALVVPALAAFVPGGYLALLGIGVARAATRAPAAFRSPADGRFLVGSRLEPRVVVAWLQARRVVGLMVVSTFNVLLILAFLPTAEDSSVSVLLLFLAVAGAYVALQTIPMAVFMLGRRLPGVPFGKLGAVLAAVGGASALLALLADAGATPAPAGPSAALLHLPPGEWLRDAYHGQAGPAVLMLLLAATAVLLTVRLSDDCYPELWESSSRLFTLRRLAREHGGALRRSDVRRAFGHLRRRQAVSASGAWVPPGAAAILWKEWLALRRTPAALAVQAGLTAGAVLVGGIVGLLLVDGDVSLASTFASLAAISLLLVNVYTGLRLGAELRNPVWWLSAASLRERLLAWTLAGTLKQAVPACLGCATALLVVGAVPVAAVSLVAVPAATWTLRAAALASYALVPSRTDLRGPGRLARVLLLQVVAVPPVVALLGFWLVTQDPVPTALAASTVLVGEGWLLLELSAWLVRRNGIAYVLAEAR